MKKLSTLPGSLNELLSDISASELADLLDNHLNDFVQLCANNGEPLLMEHAQAYFYIRKLRDVFNEMNTDQVLNAHG